MCLLGWRLTKISMVRLIVVLFLVYLFGIVMKPFVLFHDGVCDYVVALSCFIDEVEGNTGIAHVCGLDCIR